MEITDVRVYPVRDEKVRAFISIVFDRCFMVNDIKVIQGTDGLGARVRSVVIRAFSRGPPARPCPPPGSR